MTTSRRAQRVASQICRDVGEILRLKVNDPDLGFVTITRADVSGDLRHVRLMWAALGSEDDIAKSQAALVRASGHIRRELGLVLELRHTPDLEFVMDSAYQDGTAVLSTIRELNVEPPDPLSDTGG